MIKCEVIENFTLEKFGQLKNVKKVMNRKNNEFGVRDTFECDKEMADYLLGNNVLKKTVVRVVEVEPEKDNNTIEMEVSFDSRKAINKVNEIKNNGGDYEEAVKEVEKIIDETIKVKPKKKKTSKK